MTSSTNSSKKNQQLQDLTLFKVYTIYRVLLCIALLLTFFLSPSSSPFVGSLKPLQFLYSSGLYLLINALALVFILPRSKPLNSQQLFANFLIDIVAIIAIVDASNGINSGLGLLLIIIVASSSILLNSQLAVLTAAIATIAIIADTTRLISENYLTTASFMPTGLLGATFFFTAILIQYLASRIRGTQVIADLREQDVNKLQSLNQSIVQRMRTGILVVNKMGEIQLANAAASELLANPNLANNHENKTKEYLSTPIMDRFNRWKQSPKYFSNPLVIDKTGLEISANFSALENIENTDILVFLEDNRRLAQKAQQIKLASLGRLTASIAHEIRNPLGAVSHASQLLAESKELAESDKRLCEIIKKQSDRMNNVIENVLQLSSRNAPHPEQINLNDWVQEYIDEFKYEESRLTPDITLKADREHQVTIDCSQLVQVINNLVQNGLRYSVKLTGKARLHFHIHTIPATQLTALDIIDDGPGVADNLTEHLFEPFYTTEAKGSGLGLYISRELCEANEARLDYCRTEQGKSCFRISFSHSDRRLSPE